MKVLYVEDDPEALSFVGRALGERGFEVTVAATGREGLERAFKDTFDAIILDVNLPDLSGFDVLRRLRGAGVDTPVLFLTAQGEVTDRVAGLELGADDYLAKPFAFAELLARVQAVTRRRPARDEPEALAVGDLRLDPRAHRVERAGRRIDLAPKEFALLRYLMENAGHVVSRTMLIEKVWGFGFESHTNVIDVHINRLRKKVDRGFDRPLIHTVKGVGYVIEDRSRREALGA